MSDRSQRARRRATIFASLLVVACGCEDDDPPEQPLIGLYTPGSKLGAAEGLDDDAGLADGGGGLTRAEQRAIEDSITEADDQDRCAPIAGPEGTRATLVAEFESATYQGFYEPENCGAVWIEDPDGAYVATVEVWAELRLRNLFVWDARRCKNSLPVDAISTATLADHSQPHVARWNGLDHTGKITPDGPYVLNFEITEDEFNFGRRTEVPFEKGAEDFVLEPDDTETIRNLRITYAARGAAP